MGEVVLAWQFWRIRLQLLAVEKLCKERRETVTGCFTDRRLA